MEIVEHTTDRLTIEDHSWRIARVMAVLAVGIASWGWFVEGRLGPAGGSAFLLLMAWLAKYRATTSFDRSSGLVTHQFRRIARRKHRSHPLDDIVDVGVVLAPMSRSNSHYHIQVTTRDDDRFWLSPSSTGRRERLDEIVHVIHEFLTLEPKLTREDELRRMVKAGSVIEAVKLVRLEEGLSLEEAKQRVDGVVAALGGTGDDPTIEELIRTGKALQAVRRLEQEHGLSRRDARHHVKLIKRRIT